MSTPDRSGPKGRSDDKALCGEIIDFVGFDLVEGTHDVGQFGKIKIDDFDPLGDPQLVEPQHRPARRAADSADDPIAFFQQEFGEIGSVLAGYAGNQRRFPHYRLPPI
jgi:hypothetical protein